MEQGELRTELCLRSVKPSGKPKQVLKSGTCTVSEFQVQLRPVFVTAPSVHMSLLLQLL